MRRAGYPFIFLLLFAVYSLIALSPLAPLALRSPVMAHAITGQCSGDCAICGCDPERSASHTCCCWMKKSREEEMRTRRSAKPSAAKHGCCHESMPHDVAAETETEQENTIVFRCSPPCGGSGQALFSGAGEQNHIPFRFTGTLSPPPGLPLAGPSNDPLKSLYREPPDPPPRIILTA